MAAGTSIRIATLLGVALLAAFFGGSAHATSPGLNGRIVFAMVTHESITSSQDLFSMNADGSELRRLTWTPQDEGAPVWSPDGTRVAYAKRVNGGSTRIWVMNADGSGQAQLVPGTDPTFGPVSDTCPTWSPDGRQIAFARASNLMVVNADGTGLRRVASVFATDPDWSPDGTQLAYHGLDGIGVVGVDGSNPHTISGPGAPASEPTWSPDGKHIAFVRNNASGFPGELYVMNADGSGEQQLTSDGFENADPAWSPDGTQLVFERTNGGFTGWRLWSINADGSGLRQLFSGPDDARGASWGSSQVVPATSPPLDPAVQFLSPSDSDVFVQGVPSSSFVFYECISYVSVITSCQGDTPLLSQPDTSTSGLHTLMARATDAAGRTATTTTTYNVIDFVPPVATISTPADGATYAVGSQLAIDYSCADPGGSGVIACFGDKPNGSLLDTSHLGTFTFHVVAIDNARNSRTVTATYTIAGAQQTITFPPIPDHTSSDPPFTLFAVGGASGNPVTFTVAGPCSVDGTTLIMGTPGTCTVTAHQAAGSGYGAAEVSQTFSITKGPQSIGFDPLPDRSYGDPPFTVHATAGLSGQPVTFTSVGQCSNVITTVTLTGAGSCTITAHEAGGASFLPAPDVSRTFTIAKAPQTISFAPLPGHLYGDAPFPISATGGASGNPVTFSAAGACTVSGSTVTITDIGSCTVTAHQDGDANYLPAADVARTFAIDPPPGCNQSGQVHGNEDFTYGSSDVFLQSSGVCVPSLQQAAARVTLGGKVLIDAGQSGVTSVTFTRLGDVVIIGSWNGTAFRIDLHDGGKGGGLDTLRVRYGGLDTGTLTAIHGDVLVSAS